jgi:hypothetical protein
VHDLSHFTLADMTFCGALLRKAGDGARSMEETAGRIVRHLYDQLRAPDGGRACVLVRFFKTHAFAELPADLRAFACRLLGPGHDPPPPAMKCLALLASAGDLPAWNSRHTSTGHQAIPLASPEMLHRLPMISQLVHQFGVEAGLLLAPSSQLLMDLGQRTYNVFYVGEAAESPFVPAQHGFVEPFGVRSVLGFGGMLPAGDLFAVILFSRVPVSRETADLFRPLTLNVKLAVLPFQGDGAAGPVFASANELVGAGQS